MGFNSSNKLRIQMKKMNSLPNKAMHRSRLRRPGDL
jgi:hypothetical protein